MVFTKVFQILWSLPLMAVLLGERLGACEAKVINDDSVIIGDSLYSKSDNTYQKTADLLLHNLTVLNKEGVATHSLTPMAINKEHKGVTVEYQIEDLELGSKTQISLKRDEGTTCGWKDEKPVSEKRLDREHWNSDVKILSVVHDKINKKLIIEVTENCAKGDYDLRFLDFVTEKSGENFYFKVTRELLPPSVCLPDYSQTVRILAPIPSVIAKPQSTITVIGADGTSGSARLN